MQPLLILVLCFHQSRPCSRLFTEERARKFLLFSPILIISQCTVEKELFSEATGWVHTHWTAERKLARAVDSRVQMRLYHISHCLNKNKRNKKNYLLLSWENSLKRSMHACACARVVLRTTCQSSCSLMSVRVKDAHRINFSLFLLPMCNVVVIIISYGL